MKGEEGDEAFLWKIRRNAHPVQHVLVSKVYWLLEDINLACRTHVFTWSIHFEEKDVSIPICLVGLQIDFYGCVPFLVRLRWGEPSSG
jgi:hypothetical protein